MVSSSVVLAICMLISISEKATFVHFRYLLNNFFFFFFFKLNYSGISKAVIQRPTRRGLRKIRMGQSFPHSLHTAFAESVLLL